MNGIKYSNDVASQLLNSSDSRVAAAARRVFSNAVIIECKPTSKEEIEHVHNSNTSIPFDYNISTTNATTLTNQDGIPFDIKEAASAVASMLAPGKFSVVTKPKFMPAIVRNTNTFSILDNAVKGLLPNLSPPPTAVNLSSVEDPKAFTIPHAPPSPKQVSTIKQDQNSRSDVLISERKRTMSPDERLHRSRER
eukprot:CAMPEP_0176482708 /NCGR_PEP_ID=MMETSP0200_2-20121128/3521_1 /TAXON_ID=947934 /ORGANISM="Chaetoceros sp., Strain GSL56" /LENGTH=193 /DNA_ID=CAMNT_0017879045 /DNA_START=152 /DNA_END=729 /DNA_ORIENTATION=+